MIVCGFCVEVLMGLYQWPNLLIMLQKDILKLILNLLDRGVNNAMTKTIICGRCDTRITLTKLVSKAYQKGQVKVLCPKCKRPVVPKSKLPPTSDQLQYIQGLGGSITGIKNRDQAKNRINELLRIKHEKNTRRNIFL